ncbi:MAG: hypothetical protein C0609_00690 [Deltaproteobacteria bacterium]|nr:MAG: hypothetical protein C0609_00690 [Deltaproteobacteria bacterium]
MEKNVGLWVDHNKAYLITLKGERETRTRFDADFDKERTASYGSADRLPEKKVERRRMNQLKGWYGELVRALTSADRIYIFGPGKAKNELLIALEEEEEVASKVVGVDPADAMTENQMAAKVRSFYGNADKSGIPDYRRPPGA